MQPEPKHSNLLSANQAPTLPRTSVNKNLEANVSLKTLHLSFSTSKLKSVIDMGWNTFYSEAAFAYSQVST